MVVISHCKYFYICNPTTEFYKRLQDLYVSSVIFDFIQLEYYGVGYISATDDYKVLVACRKKAEYVVELFSLRARGWKRIDGPPTENYDLEYHGTFCNEALHWLSWEVEGFVAFDRAREKFRTMQLPNFTGDGKVVSKLGLSVGGCLSVSRYPKGMCDSIDFWVLREYDMHESWTKLCSLKLYEPDVLLLIDEFLVMESSIIAWHGACWGLLRIDHQAHEVEEKIGYYELHSQVCITEYVESLLWINY